MYTRRVLASRDSTVSLCSSIIIQGTMYYDIKEVQMIAYLKSDREMKTSSTSDIRTGLSQPLMCTRSMRTDCSQSSRIVWFTANTIPCAHLMDVDHSSLPCNRKLIAVTLMATGEESTCSPGLRFRSTQS